MPLIYFFSLSLPIWCRVYTCVGVGALLFFLSVSSVSALELKATENGLKCRDRWGWTGEGRAPYRVTAELMKTALLHLTPISDMGLRKHWRLKLGLVWIPQMHLWHPRSFAVSHSYTTLSIKAHTTASLSLLKTLVHLPQTGFVRHWWEGEKASRKTIWSGTKRKRLHRKSEWPWSVC